MTTYPPAFQDIADNLDLLDDWEDRYRYIIELGQALRPLTEAERNAANRVHGCVSQVWLVTEPHDGQITYRGESDAMIVRGLAAILREHLSTQRSNGLVAMVNRIRSDARARLA
jgi:cysteine desulfuration protein SufE